MDMSLPDELVRRIQSAAEQKGESLEKFLDKLIADYEAEQSVPDEPQPGTLAMLANVALEANIRSEHPVDTSERSREILNNEYADYLHSRIEDHGESTTD